MLRYFCLNIFFLLTIVSLINASPTSDESTLEERKCRNYCATNGICTLTESGPMCYCLPGWKGTRCSDVGKSVPNQEIYSEERSLNSRALVACPAAVGNPCENGGTCLVSNGNELVCGCPEDYTGDLCEIQSPCKIGKNKDNYCRDGGTCIPDADPNKPPTCMCAAGFSGFACQNPVPTTTSTTSQTTTESVACKLFPNFCANGGTCEPIKTKPACRCPPTHTGLQCKTPLGATPSQGPPVVPGQSTAAPVPGQSTAAPVPGQSTAAPVPGQSTAAPVPGQSTAAPVPGQSTAAPATRPTNLPPAGVRCDQNPCRNNRPCYNNGDSYFCSCGSQYRGINCEEFISG